MKAYDYQQKDIDIILKEFETEERLLYCLATGGGKTALFSFLTQQFIGDSRRRVLILANRIDLIRQTVNTLFEIGMRSEAVVKEKKHLMHSAQVYVAMIETIYKRLEKNPYFVPPIDLIIVDECHRLEFIKLFAHFPNIKILGVTATPATETTVTTYRDIGGEEMEYKQKFGLHLYYNKMIEGLGIQFLIQLGTIVPELVFWEEEAIKRDDLVIDELKGEFKPGKNHAAKMCVVTNYERFSKGKKTIIFTASTKDNLSLLSDFREKGYTNARIFDSVNKEESGDRLELLKWYKNTPDAILINTGVFTTGFDEPTIESVILAMSTASLSKYHQMVGRGGRSTKKIFKDKFILIDLGGNVAAFGKWSDPVDWKKHFYYKSKCLPKKEALDKIVYCDECDQIIAATALVCPHCGHEKPKKEISVSQSTVHVSELIYPSGEKVVKYCEMHSKDKNFAVELILNQAVDLFIYAEVDLDHVEATIKHGKFFKQMSTILDEQILIVQSSSLAGEYKENHITKLIDKLFKVLK